MKTISQSNPQQTHNNRVFIIGTNINKTKYLKPKHKTVKLLSVVRQARGYRLEYCTAKHSF